MMDRLLRWIDAAAAIGGAAASVFLGAIVVLITVEIGLRSGFHTSTLIADEYSAYFFVAVVMLGLPIALRDGAHIRITLVSGRLPPKGRRWLDIGVHLLAFVLCGFALYHAGLMVYDTYALGMAADSISETPIFLPQIVIPAGLLLFVLQLLAGLARRFRSFPTR
jgi:TRAP-type C4-dicarboxylate transport system permease small subunit